MHSRLARGNADALFIGTAIVAILFLAAPIVNAATYNWQLPSGDWSVSSNWGGGLPSSSDTVFVNSGGAVSVTQLGENCGTLSLGNAGGNGSLLMTSGGGLTAKSAEFIGDTGVGSFMQSGGNNLAGANLVLGNSLDSNGKYNLGGNGQLSVSSVEYVGNCGTGTFVQSSGTNNSDFDLYIGNNVASYGSYTLSGGQLLSGTEFVGYSGSGSFSQSGGTNSLSGYSLQVGYNTGSSGTYSLSGGRLSVEFETIGYSGTGAFTQSGGINNPSEELFLGGNSGSAGTYLLSSTGILSAPSESVGSATGASGLLQQTGGSNATAVLAIGNGGQFIFSGGTLNLIGKGGLTNQGGIDFTNSQATLVIGGSNVVDLSQATLANVGSMNVSLGANSLLIVPSGFNPSTSFGSFTPDPTSIVHTIGTTLNVATGQSIGGLGNVVDPVNCQGTIFIPPTGGSLNLSGGIIISGTGSVGCTNVTSNNQTSGMSGGRLAGANQFVGMGGSGQFSHSGGENDFTTVYLGYGPGDSGTYNLSGTGAMYPSSVYVGYSGTGTFTQTGGNNSIGVFGSTANLEIGYNSGSKGSYVLSGTSQLVAETEYIGDAGTGSLSQSSGVNSSSQYPELNVTIGNRVGSSGTYSLSGSGVLNAAVSYVGYSGTGVFLQSGGTHNVENLFVGYTTSGSGSYFLSGNGVLSAANESLGGLAATGLFQQTGGINTVAALSINTGGIYFLAGGTLQVNGSLSNAGIFMGGNTSATLNTSSNGIIDLSSGQNMSELSVNVGANSLLVLPTGFNPSTSFASYNNLGLTEVLGSTLSILPGQSVKGSGVIHDLVDCQGSIVALKRVTSAVKSTLTRG
jgi:hypothetical protein